MLALCICASVSNNICASVSNNICASVSNNISATIGAVGCINYYDCVCIHSCRFIQQKIGYTDFVIQKYNNLNSCDQQLIIIYIYILASSCVTYPKVVAK